MQRERRLRKSADFAAARAEGRSWADRLLVVSVRPNGSETTRFGFSVSKRLGNAVIRNRIKRRLREIARAAQVEEGFDVVIIARKDAADADFASLERSAKFLFRRARILQAE